MSIHMTGVSQFLGLSPLFEHLDLDIEKGEKVALMGKNGSGKSTLLQILAGTHIPDLGEVQVQGTVALVQQLPPDLQIPLLEHLTPEALRLAREGLEAAEHLLADPTPEHLEQYGQAEEAYRKLGGWTFQHQLEQLLSGLGLPERTFLSQLSGGQLRRVMLARVLLQPADLYLLDEPTNHLDQQGKQWLAHWIRQTPSTVLIVSHDRAFVDAVCQRTLLLERGNLLDFAGGYTRAMEQKAELEAARLRDHQAQTRKLQALAGEVQSLKSSARSSNSFNHKRAGNQALILAKNKAEHAGNQADKQARALQKRMERLQDQMPEKPYQDRTTLLIPALRGSQCPNDLLWVEGLSTFCTPDLHFHVRRGMRVALTGDNGAGKSTLLNALQQSSEQVRLGVQVRLYAFGQHHEELQGHPTLLDAFMASNPHLKRSEVFQMLGQLDLPRSPEVTVGHLSGGERTRLALACLSLTDAHLLLLDEPTNHLDVQSIEALEDFLLGFPGGMLFATHDQRLIDRVATHQLHLSDGGYTFSVQADQPVQF